MSKKHTYRTVEVQKVELAQLATLLPAAVIPVAIDVAKKKLVAAFCDPQGRHQLLVQFEHPSQTPMFLQLLEGLRAAQKVVQVVLEPTGTYGDILCYEADRRGVEVYLISPKRTHDAAEVFDGVPSYHDAKDATVIGRLHVQGVSRRWRPPLEQKRELRALVMRREIYARQQETLYGELEGLLARHWPEVQETLDVREQRSARKLLVTYPDPRQVAGAPEAVKELMERASRGQMDAEKIEAVVAGAQRTQGVEMVAAERELVQEVAAELLRGDDKIQEVEVQIRDRLQSTPKRAPLVKFVGATTVAVLIAYMGELGSYSGAEALEKAMGLNLKEASSGKDLRRGLHITKRGPGMVRKYLYLATLRWMQKDPVAAAWYKRRQGYTEQSKGKAVVALMRKLVRGVWHLSRGEEYEAKKLFDMRRLETEPQPKRQGRPAARSEVSM